MSISQADLKWRCRRGMLELDEMLNSFVDHHYEQLSSDDQLVFIQLLEESDQTLWRWFLAIEKSPEKYHDLIAHVLKAYQAQ